MNTDKQHVKKKKPFIHKKLVAAAAGDPSHVPAPAVYDGDLHIPSLADASDYDTSTSFSDHDCIEQRTSTIVGHKKNDNDQTRNENANNKYHKSIEARTSYAFCAGLFMDMFSWGKDKEQTRKDEAQPPCELDNGCPRNKNKNQMKERAVKQSEDSNEKDDISNDENDEQTLIEMGITNLLECEKSCLPWQMDCPGIQDMSYLWNECCDMIPSEYETPQQQDLVVNSRCRNLARSADPPQQLKRVRNRSALTRQEARERIQILRTSGLSRNFSLREGVSLSSNVHENKKVMQEGYPGRHCSNVHVPTISKCKTADWSGLHKLNKNRLPSQRSKLEFSKNSSCAGSNLAGDSWINCGVDPKMIHLEIVDSATSESDVELFYDSDPGPETDSGRGFTNEQDESIPSNMPLDDSLVQTFDVNSFNLSDNLATTQLVSEFIHSTNTFVWHPNNVSRRRNVPMNTSHPLIVKCWFEMGSCLRTTLVHPKLFWKSISPIQVCNKSSYNTHITAPEYIELLNIVRIWIPTDVKRDTYPFVNGETSFIITTNDSEEFMFEAKTAIERNRFLFAMKLTIARLASQIIVGDRSVFREFFLVSGENKESDDEANDNVIDEENGDEISFVSGNGSFCSSLVTPVYDQIDRTQQLWGSS